MPPTVVPAVPALPINDGDMIGNPLDEALSGQQRQSLAFANLVAGCVNAPQAR